MAEDELTFEGYLSLATSLLGNMLKRGHLSLGIGAETLKKIKDAALSIEGLVADITEISYMDSRWTQKVEDTGRKLILISREIYDSNQCPFIMPVRERFKLLYQMVAKGMVARRNTHWSERAYQHFLESKLSDRKGEDYFMRITPLIEKLESKWPGICSGKEDESGTSCEDGYEVLPPEDSETKGDFSAGQAK